LKLQSDEPPSNFAFKFNLRRHNVGPWTGTPLLFNNSYVALLKVGRCR
jgi:hypothetical protein